MKLKLNLGCGANLLEGWVNVDVDDVEETYLRHLRSAPSVEGWPEWQRKQWEFLKGGGVFSFVRGNLMNETPGWHNVYEGLCDAIYLGQVVEHLNPITELPALLNRCYGALKPGGVLRITTPDFALILQEFDSGNMGSFAAEQPGYYEKADPYDQLSYLLFGATGPNCTRSNYEGHFHVYCRDTLLARCREAGFSGEPSYDWPSKRLPDVRDFGKSHSFALELTR